jgi:hypothetical protein
MVFKNNDITEWGKYLYKLCPTLQYLFFDEGISRREYGRGYDTFAVYKSAVPEIIWQEYMRANAFTDDKITFIEFADYSVARQEVGRVHAAALRRQATALGLEHWSFDATRIEPYS